MKPVDAQGGFIIIVTFVVGYLLNMLQLPEPLQILRPYWVAMILIYWCMALPHRVGIGTGWLVGIGLDIVEHTLIGQHALGLALVAFLTVSLHQRIRVFPLWQQSLTILVFCLIYALINVWVNGITGHAPPIGRVLVPVVMTALLWAPVFLLMRRIRRQFSVT